MLEFLELWNDILEHRRVHKRAKRNQKILTAYHEKGLTVATLADIHGLKHAEVQDILDGGHGPYVRSRKTS